MQWKLHWKFLHRVKKINVVKWDLVGEDEEEHGCRDRSGIWSSLEVEFGWGSGIWLPKMKRNVSVVMSDYSGGRRRWWPHHSLLLFPSLSLSLSLSSTVELRWRLFSVQSSLFFFKWVLVSLLQVCG